MLEIHATEHTPDEITEHFASLLDQLSQKAQQERKTRRGRASWMRENGHRFLRGLGCESEITIWPHQDVIGLRGFFFNVREDGFARAFECSASIVDGDIYVTSETPVMFTEEAFVRCVDASSRGGYELDEFEWGFASAHVFRHIARARNWKQVGVPTGRGLFTGYVLENGIVLDSYRLLGDDPRNPLDDHWGPFVPPARDMIGTFPYACEFGANLTDWMCIDVNERMLHEDFLIPKILESRCPFLLNAREPVARKQTGPLKRVRLQVVED